MYILLGLFIVFVLRVTEVYETSMVALSSFNLSVVGPISSGMVPEGNSGSLTGPPLPSATQDVHMANASVGLPVARNYMEALPY
jgi:hypothetical protein